MASTTNISYKIAIKVPNNAIKATNNIQKVNPKNEKYNARPTQKTKKAFKIKRWLKGLLIAVGAYLLGSFIAYSLGNSIGSGASAVVASNFIILLILVVAIVTVVFVVIGIRMFIQGLRNKD